MHLVSQRFSVEFLVPLRFFDRHIRLWKILTTKNIRLFSDIERFNSDSRACRRLDNDFLAYSISILSIQPLVKENKLK